MRNERSRSFTRGWTNFKLISRQISNAYEYFLHFHCEIVDNDYPIENDWEYRFSRKHPARYRDRSLLRKHAFHRSVSAFRSTLSLACDVKFQWKLRGTSASGLRELSEARCTRWISSWKPLIRTRSRVLGAPPFPSYITERSIDFSVNIGLK